MRIHVVLAALLVSLLSFARPVSAVQSDTVSRYNEAVRHYNEGRIAEAVDVLAALLEEHPLYYDGHSFYWDALGKVATAREREDAVRASLEAFDEVSDEQRTESFYTCYVKGAELLEHPETAEQLRVECIERFPRGSFAQLSRLRQARACEDPRECVRLLSAYIDEFPEQVSWCRGAARDRFRRMVQNEELWSVESIVEAADAWDSLTVESVRMYGNPTRRVVNLREIARTFADIHPERASVFVERGVRFVMETAATTDEFDETAVDLLLDPLLESQVRLEQWQPASATAQALLANPRPKMSEEARHRALHAKALEPLGRIDSARNELGYAVVLDSSWQPELDRFHTRHPLDDGLARRFEQRQNELRESLRNRRKAELLAQQELREAAPFRLGRVGGGELALEDLAGKVVVLDFWATTCGPCIAELAQLQKAYVERYRAAADVEFVAVSTDTNKALVAPFVKGHGYSFPVLLTDGRIEAPYGCETTIPQLYVLDPSGRIRFHHEGYLADGFLERLDWMIEAAGRPHPSDGDSGR